MRWYRVWLLVAAVAAAAGVRAPLGAAGVESAVLRSVASRLDARTSVLTIEASVPVAYVASQPDPRSFVVELRDVVATGAFSDFTPDPRSPLTAVRVESAVAADGARVARVNVGLSQPGRPRVKSSRNLIIVEADRLDLSGAGAIMPRQAGRRVISDVRVARLGTGTAVTLVGIGPLTPIVRQGDHGRPAPRGAGVRQRRRRRCRAPSRAGDGAGLAGAHRPEHTLAARDRSDDGPGARRRAPRRVLRRRPEPERRVRRRAAAAARGRGAAAPRRCWSAWRFRRADRPPAGRPFRPRRRAAGAGCRRRPAPQAPQSGTRDVEAAGPALHRSPGQPRLPGRRPALGAAHLLRDQRPQPGDRPLDPGHGGRVAARRAVGSGARHHPARQPARLRRWTAPSSAWRR